MITPAKRMEKITYAIRDVVVEAKKLEKQGKKILYLNIGDPNKYDFQTPKHMWKGIVDNEQKSECYGYALGIDEARVAIAKDAKKKGVNCSEDDIIIGNGVSEVIQMAVAALVNNDNNILTPSPGYPLYTGLVNYFQLQMNEYKLDEEQEWEPDIDSIRKSINEKTKALILINPNNPTGGIYSKNKLKSILDVAGEHNLVIFADEIYDKMLLDDDLTHHSCANLAKDLPTLTFGGLSKNYLCPGWRVGWACFTGNGIENYKGAVAQLARARLCSVHPQQFAVKPALEGPQDHIPKTNAKLRKRRDLTFKRLNEIPGLSCVKPKAAFYAFPKINLNVDDKEFIMKLLREEGVLGVFGSGFGTLGKGHFRIVYLAQDDVLANAYDKIDNFVKRNYVK